MCNYTVSTTLDAFLLRACRKKFECHLLAYAAENMLWMWRSAFMVSIIFNF